MVRMLQPHEIRPDPFGREVEFSVDRDTLHRLREWNCDPRAVRQEWAGRTWLRVESEGPGRSPEERGSAWASRLARLEQLDFWRHDADPAWGWVALPKA